MTDMATPWKFSGFSKKYSVFFQDEEELNSYICGAIGFREGSRVQIVKPRLSRKLAESVPVSTEG